MVAYTAQRLQTNAAWSAEFRFANTNLTAWTLAGRALSSQNSTRYVDLAMNTQITVSDANNGTFSVTLTPLEANTLGPGTVTFEIVRTDPLPKRPVLRFTIKNHPGVAA
jgi:hypothetical protein